MSIVNDAEFLKTDINQTLFPKAGGSYPTSRQDSDLISPLLLPDADDVQVHDGFSKAHGRTADTVLATVKAGLAKNNASKIAITGHSLGAAIATMDAVMLRQNLDPSVEISTVVFGLPRGGNQAWADLVDSEV